MTRTFLFLIACLPLSAAEKVVDLDPTRTSVTFTLGSVLHTVHGSFKLKRGTVRFDPESDKAGGEVVVDVTSGDTGNESRDRRMHKEILESGRYPDAVFIPDMVSGRLAPEGQSQIDLHGVFRFHGAAHDMTLHLTILNSQGELSATTDFTIPYVQWGLKNPSTFLLRVSDKVQMRIEASGHMQSGGVAAAPNSVGNSH